MSDIKDSVDHLHEIHPCVPKEVFEEYLEQYQHLTEYPRSDKLSKPQREQDRENKKYAKRRDDLAEMIMKVKNLIPVSSRVNVGDINLSSQEIMVDILNEEMDKHMPKIIQSSLQAKKGIDNRLSMTLSRNGISKTKIKEILTDVYKELP